MFNWLKKMFIPERKALILPRLPLPTSSSVSDEQLVSWALQIPYIVSAVDLISNAVANLPFEYDTKELQKLIDQPNSSQSQMLFFQEIVKDVLYYGNAYVLLGIVRNRIKEMWVLEPQHVKIEVNKLTGEIKSYKYMVNGFEESYPPEQIVHIKIPDPSNPILGRSPLRSIEYTIQQYIYMKLWNITLLKNQARPSGAFVVESNLTESQYERLKTQMEEQLSGGFNSGRPIILEGGMDWKELSLTPSELDWLTSQRMLIREISVAFGIAPELLGDSENKTYSNFQEARRQLYYNTVLPLAETVVYEFNNAFNRYRMGSFEIQYSDIDALSEDRADIMQQVLDGVRAGVLTINEAREELGLPPIKGGDQIFMPANLMPMLAGFEEMQYED